MKVVSCGVLVWSSGLLLLGQPTGRRFWDIPKGVAEPGEAWADCAARELAEETGLEAAAALRPLGQHRYLPAKDLVLFAWTPERPIDPAALRCRSMVTWPDGRRVPELARFGLFAWVEALERVGKSLASVLGSIGADPLDLARGVEKVPPTSS